MIPKVANSYVMFTACVHSRDDGHYEEAFAKMKKAAGVSDVEEVVKR